MDKIIVELDGKDVNTRMEEEGGSSGKGVTYDHGHHIIPGFPFKGVIPIRLIVVRASLSGIACERGDLYLVQAGCNGEHVHECIRFPIGTPDDVADGASGAPNELLTEMPLMVWTMTRGDIPQNRPLTLNAPN
jgi:phage terminase large subunit-like protein